MPTVRGRAGLARAVRRAARALGSRRTPARRLLLPAAAVALLAAAVRLAYVGDAAPTLYTWEQPGVRMAARYSEAASGLLRGDGLLYPRVWPDPHDTGLLSRPPGYPAFVAAVQRTLGGSYPDVLLTQAVVTSLLPVLMLFLVARVAGLRAGIAAGILAALSPPLAYHAAVMTPDALSALLAVAIVFLLWCGRRAGPRAQGAWLVAAGLVCGVTTWLRPNFLLLAPLLALATPAALGGGRRVRQWALALALAGVALVAPITLRNFRLFGAFVPVSANGGIVLWEGIADAGGERFGARRTDPNVAAEEAVRFSDSRYAKWWASPDGIARDRDRTRRSLEVIRANPLWYAASVARRAGEVIASGAQAPLLAAGAPRLEADAEVASHPALRVGTIIAPARPLLHAVQRLAAWPGALLRAAGLALLLVLAPRRALLLLLVPGYVLLVQSPMHFEPRFALPLEAFSPAFEAVALAFVLAAAAGAARRYWM